MEQPEHPETFPTTWIFQARPLLCTRRIEFAAYAETKAFLDALAELSEKTGIYPNINFSRHHVLLTLYPAFSAFEAREILFAYHVESCIPTRSF